MHAHTHTSKVKFNKTIPHLLLALQQSYTHIFTTHNTYIRIHTHIQYIPTHAHIQNMQYNPYNAANKFSTQSHRHTKAYLLPCTHTK